MSKIFSLVITVVLCTLVLAGCASNSSNNSGGVSSPPATPSASDSGSTQPASSSTSDASASVSPTASASPAASEKPVAPEKSPVGDIPDSQAFVNYKSASGGYSFKAPEGWARTEQGADVSFVEKLDGVKVSVISADTAPTVDSIMAGEAADLVKNGRAVKDIKVKEVTVPSGKAIQVVYTSNSEPNAVTGKQIRQDNVTYYYFNNKKLAAMTLWAPLGADNVDQWKLMSDSFSWSTQ
jgi:hypothetical protein